MISVKNVDKKFGDLHVLRGVSCEIKDGERVAIIGPSGSGKSTLLRCMNLLEEPNGGEIWLGDAMLTPADPYLHDDILCLSNTYATMLAAARAEKANSGKADKELSAEICRAIVEGRLLKKHEGKAFSSALRALETQQRLDINLARRNMGMVFQHFNLFNNLTVLGNLMLAPVQLKLKSREERRQE